ncbi:MAG: type II toxin-antitoxin system VapC family toxin [Deltaproteobacteria bacterium]|nr:type II toxin-antitoxin system VapC family toxin [Deltaproteobacteria bacterium]
MKFWDSSALIPLFFEEGHSETVQAIAKDDGNMIVWWATILECRSAIARLRREGTLSNAEEDQLLDLVKDLAGSWTEISPGENVRNIALRLLSVHPLRAADSLQLAAALIWADLPAQNSEFVSLDQRLREAARKEGFSVLPKAAM